MLRTRMILSLPAAAAMALVTAVFPALPAAANEVTPAALTAAALPAAAARAAGGGTVTGCTGYQAGGGWWVQCQSGGNPGGSGTGGEQCTWSTNVDHYFPGLVQADPPPKGFIYIVGPICPDSWPNGPGPIFIYAVRNGGQLTPAALAQQAYAELRPPLPAPQTAPPRGSDGLVGLPEWFWVPENQWAPQTVRLAVGPVWAAVTATPDRLTITPGGSLPAVSCPGPGTAYNTAEPAAAQHSNCTYTYIRSSAGLPANAYTVTVTISWAATWRGSGGTGGTLPALSRSATFLLPVAEGQALNTGSSG